MTKYFFLFGLGCAAFASRLVCPVACQDKFETRTVNYNSDELPQCIKNLNCDGRDEFTWKWYKSSQTEIELQLRLSAATVRWNFPYFVGDEGDALFNLFTTGLAKNDSRYCFRWKPYHSVEDFFGKPVVNFHFRKTLSKAIKANYRSDMGVFRKAWGENVGVIMFFYVNSKDGTVKNASGIERDLSWIANVHPTGEHWVLGGSRFPGNQLKILFNAADALYINNKFKKSDAAAFLTWLTSEPLSHFQKLKLKLEENGSFFRNGIEYPVWGVDSFSVFEYLIEHYMVSDDKQLFEQILDMAYSTKGGTGFLLDFSRYSEGDAMISVEKQYKPNAYHDADYFKKDGMGAEDRTYTCVFGTASQIYLLKWLSDNSDPINDLFFYMWLTDIWSNGSKLIKHETSDDLSDLYLIIGGEMDQRRIRKNSYKNWQHFRSFVIESLQNRTQTNLEFKVFYSTGHNKFQLTASSKL